MMAQEMDCSFYWYATSPKLLLKRRLGHYLKGSECTNFWIAATGGIVKTNRRKGKIVPDTRYNLAT